MWFRHTWSITVRLRNIQKYIILVTSWSVWKVIIPECAWEKPCVAMLFFHSGIAHDWTMVSPSFPQSWMITALFPDVKRQKRILDLTESHGAKRTFVVCACVCVCVLFWTSGHNKPQAPHQGTKVTHKSVSLVCFASRCKWPTEGRRDHRLQTVRLLTSISDWGNVCCVYRECDLRKRGNIGFKSRTDHKSWSDGILALPSQCLRLIDSKKEYYWERQSTGILTERRAWETERERYITPDFYCMWVKNGEKDVNVFLIQSKNLKLQNES